ncbi:Nuclear pore complex protein Nup50 [Pseudolycoriella hygida]|uniref:Nuclear pore complex protein Nup50 n=1 Tax=Pseudolycoriella hygida TaxID=35572 RepID=A0A9Q0MTX7_9DIPT|nr:Nuclear pore complex protein Nup50 [Pseudolycoriella hygida]
MSTKRRPGSDLNQENWDKEEEPEEQGHFQKASQEEIAKRTIKTAKRRINTAAESDSGAKPVSNLFSSFGGFGKDNAKSGPLAFSFLNTTTAANGDSSSEKQNSASKQSQEPAIGVMDDKKQLDYYGKLKGLNQSLAEWVRKKVEQNAFCILTPIFDDYAKHLKAIQENHVPSTGIEAKSAVVTTSTNTLTSKTEPAKTLTSASLGSTSTTSTNKISNQLAPSFSTEKKTDETKKDQPLFSFGGLTSTASTSSTFSFGGPGVKPFTFGNVVAKPAESSKPSDTNEADGDDDQPPVYEFVPVVEKDNFYSKKCKVFVKNDKAYSDRGVGMLYLKKVEGSEKIQLLVRADTSLGNILLNVLLSEGMPTQRMGKNNVMIICLPLPDAKAPTSVLIRVKNEEEADELLTQINKNKK